jgi:hypothetical protein
MLTYYWVDENSPILYNLVAMKTRSRTTSGAFRTKRSDTLVGSIERKYGVDLGVRSDTKLSTYLKEAGYNSLSKLLEDVKG